MYAATAHATARIAGAVAAIAGVTRVTASMIAARTAKKRERSFRTSHLLSESRAMRKILILSVLALVVAGLSGLAPANVSPDAGSLIIT